MRRFVSVVTVLSVCLLASTLHAAVGVGDKPDLKFAAANGGSVDLTQLKGKLVLVDFWATWCGPCMAEAPHMVQINKEYADKGLVLVGISLDSDKGKMLEVASRSNFTWPQHFDGQGWGNAYAKAWGVNSIPATFLISPDGEVIWKGHPSQIDAALADGFKNHPPRLVDPKVLAEATANLEKLEAALKSGDKASAAKFFGKIPADAKKEKALSPRVDAAVKELDEYASGIMDEAEKLAADKQFTAAIPKLRDLSKMTGLAAAKKAAEKLTELQASPEVKTQIAAAEKAEKEKERLDKATAALAIAQKLQTEKKDEQAYTQFQAVAKTFEGTPAAASASDAVKAYEKDANFIKRVKNAQAESQAKAAMNLAASYKAAGRNDLARKKYQQLIDGFPGTSVADQAKKAIEELPEGQ